MAITLDGGDLWAPDALGSASGGTFTGSLSSDVVLRGDRGDVTLRDDAAPRGLVGRERRLRMT